MYCRGTEVSVKTSRLMRSEVENPQQPLVNQLVGLLLVRWGFVSPWGQNPRTENTLESDPLSERVQAGVARL